MSIKKKVILSPSKIVFILISFSKRCIGTLAGVRIGKTVGFRHKPVLAVFEGCGSVVRNFSCS